MKSVGVRIQKNFPLRRLTTFQIGGNARYFAKISTQEQLTEAIAWQKAKKIPLMVLGRGSNMLVADRGFAGLVLLLDLRGFTVERETATTAWVRVAAGEPWDNTVGAFVKRGLWGAENLSLIPGSTGAAAIQNIEAYGHEAKNIITSVTVLDTKTEKIVELSRAQCHFRYRQSIFNSSHKGRYVVLSTLFALQKKGRPVVTYPDVIRYFTENTRKTPSLASLRTAIIHIRSHKLPDWRVVGNAGSFFKNVYLTPRQYRALYKKVQPIFTESQLEKLETLKKRFVTVAGIKIPTAFLIEALGLKGLRIGGAQVHKDHALILINATGRATAQDVMRLVKKIRTIVSAKTGLKIVPEPELVGFTARERRVFFGLS